MSARVLISIVTFNSAPHLRRCLRSLMGQTFTDIRVCLWDNASNDATLEIASAFGDLLDDIRSSNRNVGFCAAHNRVIDSCDSEYVLVLNPDVVLEKEYVGSLAAAMDGDAGVGSATGKLWRWPDDPSGRLSDDGLFAEPPQGARFLDTTGIYFTPAQRHFDRGSGVEDTGQYQRRELVFGASGAAACYRRKMLEEVRSGREYFDEDFFAFREDADLAWRAQWLGWKCLYVPEAKGFHVRRVLPERRRLLPPDVNMHSFKNRFLLRVKNMDAGTYARFFVPITFRDLSALAYVLVCEPSSLRALPLLTKALPRAWAVRKALQRHRRAPASEVRSWFSHRPVAKPVDVSGR